jgi:hypothetical protein
MSVLKKMYKILKPILQEMKGQGFQNLPLDYPGVAEACMLYQQAPELRTELVATSLTPKELCTSIWDDATMTFRTCLNTLTRSVYMLPSGAVFADVCTNTVVVARDDALYTLRLDALDEPDQQPTLLFTATCYLADFCASRHGFLLFGDYMQAKVWLLDVASTNIVFLDLDFACYYYFTWLDNTLDTNSAQPLDTLETNPTQTPYTCDQPCANCAQTLDTLETNPTQTPHTSAQTLDTLKTNPTQTPHTSAQTLDTLETNPAQTLHTSAQTLDTLETNPAQTLHTSVQAGSDNNLDETMDTKTSTQGLAFFQVGTNKITLQETKTVRTVASISTKHVA